MRLLAIAVAIGVALYPGKASAQLQDASDRGASEAPVSEPGSSEAGDVVSMFSAGVGLASWRIWGSRDPSGPNQTSAFPHESEVFAIGELHAFVGGVLSTGQVFGHSVAHALGYQLQLSGTRSTWLHRHHLVYRILPEPIGGSFSVGFGWAAPVEHLDRALTSLSYGASFEIRVADPVVLRLPVIAVDVFPSVANVPLVTAGVALGIRGG